MKHILFAAALAVLPVAAQAQMSTDDLIRQLNPRAGGPSRGIHAMPAEAPAASQADAGTASRARTSRIATRATASTTMPAAPQGQANLTVQFDTGSDHLTAAATRTLDTLGRALASSDLAADKFRIVGHTDTVGNPDANQALSVRRAEAVVSYLAQTFKIDPARLAAVGVGQSQPLVPTAAGVASLENRRVQVINLGA